MVGRLVRNITELDGLDIHTLLVNRDMVIRTAQAWRIRYCDYRWDLFPLATIASGETWREACEAVAKELFDS